MPKEELKKRHKIEENKKKKREEKMKMIEDERRKKMQDVLEKENAKFKYANKKEDIILNNQKNIHIGTVVSKDDLAKKAKEVELRNDRIFKNQTVYKKGIYEMPQTFG